MDGTCRSLLCSWLVQGGRPAAKRHDRRDREAMLSGAAERANAGNGSGEGEVRPVPPSVLLQHPDVPGGDALAAPVRTSIQANDEAHHRHEQEVRWCSFVMLCELSTSMCGSKLLNGRRCAG